MKSRRKVLAPNPTSQLPAVDLSKYPALSLSDLTDQLRVEVKRVIKDTTASSYPAVWDRLAAGKQGYLQVENAVINVVINSSITPSAALAQLESTWGEI